LEDRDEANTLLEETDDMDYETMFIKGNKLLAGVNEN
jgi:hypothetical protein